MAKGKTPNPIRGPFDKRLTKEYKDMKRLADEKGGQYQKNLDVSYEPESNLIKRLQPEITVERLMKKNGYSRELAERIAKKLRKENPYSGQGYKNLGEAVGDFVEGATYLPRRAYYGYKDVISNLRGKDVGKFTPASSNSMFDAGEEADFQRRNALRLGTAEYPEKIQYKSGGRVKSKIRGAGAAQKGIRPAKMR